MNLPSPSISLSPAYVDSLAREQRLHSHHHHHDYYHIAVCLSRFEFSSSPFFSPSYTNQRKERNREIEREREEEKTQFETIRSVGFFLLSQRQLTAARKKKKGKIVNIAPMPLGFFLVDARTQTS